MSHRSTTRSAVRTGSRSTSSRGGLRRRLGTATLAAVLACAPLPALASTPVAPTAWNGPSSSYGAGGGWSWGGGQPSGDGWGSTSGSGSTATVDSDPATAAESSGVVLIDTAVSGGSGAGTGIVLTADGQVLTNYHVVEGATAIEVTVATTGRSDAAEVVGHSTTSDVALLQLEDATGLTPATLDDDTVATGDAVTAVGNAGGTGSLTAADGRVTDLDADITTASEYGIAGESLTGLIETDADVVPGDSGGPLLDAEGEVVGVDTAASSGGEIDGYAIPIDDALAAVRQIRSGESTGTVQVGARGFLGVQVANGVDGALVEGVVSGSAASSAGLAAGDVITSVDGSTVTSGADVSSALATTSAGDQVAIGWTDSSGASHQAEVTLGSNPAA